MMTDVIDFSQFAGVQCQFSKMYLVTAAAITKMK